MKLLRQTIRRLILEAFDSYDKLTRDEQLDLRLMGHDKGHIDLENSTAIKKAFQYYSEMCNAPLYRGVYNTETRILEGSQVGDTFQLGRVTSLSENESEGIKFAKRNRGNMIELVPGAIGFNLAAIIVQWYDAWEARYPRDFEEQMADHPRKVAKDEAEWLMPADATYELLDISERGGVTVYKLQMV